MAFGSLTTGRADFRSEALRCLPSDLRAEHFPAHVMNRVLNAATYDLSLVERPREDYHAFRDRMIALAVSCMTEAERDERTMTKLGRLYGSSV